MLTSVREEDFNDQDEYINSLNKIRSKTRIEKSDS